MSERGVFAVAREIFDDPDFADEPFTEREAFMWLVSEASWKPRTRRVGNHVVELKRGQLAASIRHLARTWQWGVATVERFLAKWREKGSIGTDIGTGITVITICKFNKYQRVSLPSGTENGTAAEHQRNNTEDIKTLNTTTLSGAGILHPATEDVVREIEPALKIDRDFVPPEWMGARYRISAGLSSGWQPDIVVSSVKRQAARKQSPPLNFSYYERGIAEDHARAVAPVPEAKIIPAETVEVRRAAKTGNIADGFAEARAELRALAGASGLRDATGGVSVRAIPKIGRDES